MKFYLKVWPNILALCLCVGSIGLSEAVDAPLAVVNGVSIDARLLENIVKANVAQGQNDTAELRSTIKKELIGRELMAQEAQKRGLDKLQTSLDALLGLKHNLYNELVLNDELSKKPITDVELKAEYDRQVKALSATELQQFQISTIVVNAESEAKEVLVSLRSGKAFEELAKTLSIDPSKDRGGEAGWFLADQMTPAISNVVVNLAPGVLSVAPIQVGKLWYIVKLLAKRPYPIPGFEESKSLVQSAVVQNRRAALLKKLSDTAIVKKPLGVFKRCSFNVSIDFCWG